MFHSSRTARTAANSELPNTSPLGNKTNILTALMLMSSINAGMAASDIPHSRPADQIAYVRDLCSEVIGFQPGEEHFKGCVSSLVDSLRNASHEHATVQARSQCFAQRLNPGSSDLALCLLQAANAHPASGAWTAPDDLNAIDNKDDRATSAQDFTPLLGSISDREQQACARLGFDPAFGDFANCVAKLQSAVQNIDMPSN
jgi:hypothetical protein